VADAAPSNWMILVAMQRLAKNPSSLATWDEECTPLGGATETPPLILRITLQLCADAPRPAASAIATTPAANAMKQIDRHRFDMARFPSSSLLRPRKPSRLATPRSRAPRISR